MKNSIVLFATVLVLCLNSIIVNAQEPCLTWVNPPPNSGYTDFNGNFGGAPVSTEGDCPLLEIDSFEIWAGEAYVLDNVIEGTIYTFSHCNGPGAGSWSADYTIIAPGGAVDAFGEGNPNGCSISWEASESGTYLIVINEQGLCGESNTVENGHPAINCGLYVEIVNSFVSGSLFVDYDCNGVFDPSDFGVGGVSFFSSGILLDSESFPNGDYEVTLIQNLDYDVLPEPLPGIEPITPFSVSTTQEPQFWTSVDFALCPIQNYFDLELLHAGPGSWNWNSVWPIDGSKTVILKIVNQSPHPSDGTLVIQFPDEIITVLNDGGGIIEGGELTVEFDPINPYSESFIELEFTLNDNAIVTDLFSFYCAVIGNTGIFEDQVPENNVLVFQSMVGNTNGVVPYCDYPQSSSGFPADLACQNSVCSLDPWCCVYSWDLGCANWASSSPACTDCIFESTTTSIQDTDLLSQEILLFPNPARGMAQVALPDGLWQVSLMDISGKTIHRFESVSDSLFSLNLSSLAPGLYFVSVESEGERFVKKLVVE